MISTGPSLPDPLATQIMELSLDDSDDLTDEQVKAAFRAAAMKWHPDRHRTGARWGQTTSSSLLASRRGLPALSVVRGAHSVRPPAFSCREGAGCDWVQETPGGVRRSQGPDETGAVRQQWCQGMERQGVRRKRVGGCWGGGTEKTDAAVEAPPPAASSRPPPSTIHCPCPLTVLLSTYTQYLYPIY